MPVAFRFEAFLERGDSVTSLWLDDEMTFRDQIAEPPCASHRRPVRPADTWAPLRRPWLVSGSRVRPSGPGRHRPHRRRLRTPRRPNPRSCPPLSGLPGLWSPAHPGPGGHPRLLLHRPRPSAGGLARQAPHLGLEVA